MKDIYMELLKDFAIFAANNPGFMLILTVGLAFIFLGPVACIAALIMYTIAYIVLGVLFEEES